MTSTAAESEAAATAAITTIADAASGVEPVHSIVEHKETSQTVDGPTPAVKKRKKCKPFSISVLMAYNICRFSNFDLR